MDNNNGTTTSIPSPLSSLFPSQNDQSTSFYPSNYQHQRNSSQQFDPGQTSSYIDVKTPLFDEFLTPPSSSPSYIPVNNNNNSSTSVHSYMNVSFKETTNDTTSSSSYTTNHHHNTPYPY